MKNFYDALVSDEEMLEAISEVGGKLYELEGHLKTTSKVVHGKIRSMLKRFVLPSNVELIDAPPPSGTVYVTTSPEERLEQLRLRAAELSVDERAERDRLLLQFPGETIP